MQPPKQPNAPTAQTSPEAESAMARELPNDQHGMRILKELEPLPEEKGELKAEVKKEDSVAFKGLDQLYGGSLVEEVKKDQDEKAKRIVEQFNKLKQAVADRDKVISNLRAEMDAKDQELKVKMDSILTLENETNKLKHRLDEAETGLAALNTEKAELITNHAQLNAGHQELKRANLKLQDRLNQLRDENTKQERLISDLQANIQNLLLQIDGYAGAEAKLEEATRKALECTQREAEMTAFAAAMEAKKKEITEKYETFTGEAKAMNDRISGYEAKIGELEKALSDEKAEHEAKIAELTKAKQEAEATLKESAEQQKTVATEGLDAEKKAQEFAMLETTLKAKEEDLAKAREKIVQLEARLLETEAAGPETGGGGKKGKGKGKKKGGGTQFDAVAEEINLLKEQNEETQRKLAEAQKAHESLKAEAERVCKELEASKKGMSEKEERIKSLCEEMEKLQGELASDKAKAEKEDVQEFTPLPDEPTEAEVLPMMEPLEEEPEPEPPPKKKKKK